MKMKERILSYLEKDARITPADIATMLGVTEKEVKDIIAECEENGTIMNYHTVINWDKAGKNSVTALLELKPFLNATRVLIRLPNVSVISPK